MKNAFKLGVLAMVLSVSVIACDPKKDKEKQESVTDTKTEIDTTKTDTSATATAAIKDTVVMKETKKVEVKSSN